MVWTEERGKQVLFKMIKKAVLGKKLIQGESFSTALEKMKLSAGVWPVLEGRKTQATRRATASRPNASFDEFTKVSKRKLSGFNRAIMGIGFLIVSMYLILLLPTLTMIEETKWKKWKQRKRLHVNRITVMPLYYWLDVMKRRTKTKPRLCCA